MVLDKIYCPEEPRERADKALRLNGFTGPLLPKTRIKRFAGASLPAVNGGPKLQSASRRQSVEEHLTSCELRQRVVKM
jgi:hypothetical protein